jgi:DHA1 family multidrug resistance protein-like MFS transporter
LKLFRLDFSVIFGHTEVNPPISLIFYIPPTKMWSLVQYCNIRNDTQGEKQSHHGQTFFKRNDVGDRHGAGNGHDGPTYSDGDSKAADDHNRNGDQIIVEPRGEDDPINPKNWPLLSRAKNIAIIALLISAQAWSGAAESMANSEASKDFHVSQTAENLSTAMYLFGIGTGCLFVGPLSETVGRNPTYLFSTFCYLFFVLGTALTKTFAGQVVCRYFVGLFSSATLGINGATVRDQFRPVKRAFVFPVIAWANVVRKSSCRNP